jgi:hypothetical protein
LPVVGAGERDPVSEAPPRPSLAGCVQDLLRPEDGDRGELVIVDDASCGDRGRDLPALPRLQLVERLRRPE